MTDTADIRDDIHWQDGDVSLISSDNVRFRIASHVLCWSSPIFADMLALPSPQCPSNDKTLHLTDIQFEHNEIIDLFLHLVTCQPKELRFDEPGEEWTDLVSLLRFLDKYDSQRGLQLLRAYGAEGVLNQTFSVDRAFIFASLTNDLGLCIAILRQNSNHRWGKNKGTTALYRSSSVPGGALFSPRTSSLEFFGSLPLPYIWALSRTEGEVELSKDRDKFCKKFRTYVRAALEVLDLGHESYSGLHRPFPNIIKTPTESELSYADSDSDSDSDSDDS